MGKKVAIVGSVLVVALAVGIGIHKYMSPRPQPSPGASGSAQNRTDGATSQVATAGPQVAVERLAVNLGRVPTGQKRSGTFTIGNTSDKPLNVLRAVSDCDCLSFPGLPMQLQPGAMRDLTVDFAAPKNSGQYSHKIVLQTDDKSRPTITLKFEASVGMPLEVKPAILDLGYLAAGQERTVNVTIVNHGDKPIRPLYSTSSGPGQLAMVPRATIDPEGMLEIPIRVTASNSPRGFIGTVVLHTDCTGQPTVDIALKYTTTQVASNATSAPASRP